MIYQGFTKQLHEQFSHSTSVILFGWQA
jgi:hypothetical protein